MKGILLGIERSKDSDSEKGSESSDYLDEAWDAIKDDDKAGFKAAIKAYARSCRSKPTDDDDDGDDD